MNEVPAKLDGDTLPGTDSTSIAPFTKNGETNEIDKHNARGLFGLCTSLGDGIKGRIEIAEGRANINLQPEDVSYIPSSPIPLTK